MFSTRTFVAAVAAASLVAPATAQATYRDAVLADQPLTYLKLDEASGVVAADSSPNGHHGTLSGATLDQTPAFAGGGRSARLAQAGGIAATVPARSGAVELWVKPARRGAQGFAAHGDPATKGWAVGINAKRKLVFVTGGAEINSRITVPTGAWTMVVVGWHADRVRFSVNGGATVKERSLGSVAAPAATGPLSIGATGAGRFPVAFEGGVDEVAVYGGDLDAARVRAHFAESALPFGGAPPAISGKAEVGRTLVVQPGTWTGATSAPTHEWQRCDAQAEDCAEIPGATTQSYTVTAADAGSTLQVVETVTNAAGSTTAVSEPTGVVPGVPPASSADGGTGTPGAGGDPAPGGDGGVVAVEPAPAVTPADPGTVAEADVAGSAVVTAGGAPAGDPAATVAHTRCLRLARPVSPRKVGRLGVFRARAGRGGCLTATSPLVLTVKGKRLAKVAYRADGRAVKAARRGTFTGKVTVSRLKAGRHVLVVRVTPKRGKARSIKVTLRTVRA